MFFIVFHSPDLFVIILFKETSGFKVILGGSTFRMLPGCVNRAAYSAARAVCRQEILTKGICEIPGFLQPEAVRKILCSAEQLKKRPGCGFRSFEEHNVYLEEKADVSRIRSASFSSSKVLINQAELAEDCPELIELFHWDGLRQLLQEAFGLEKLFCSADPLGGVYLNFFEKGDQLGWHFDRSECLNRSASASIL